LILRYINTNTEINSVKKSVRDKLMQAQDCIVHEEKKMAAPTQIRRNEFEFPRSGKPEGRKLGISSHKIPTN
jgi:hypothetical protein